MQNLDVRLESAASNSFRCRKAANSLDIDVAKKLVHELHIDAEIDAPFSVGAVVGASGSGKTTLAEKVWALEPPRLKSDEPVIDQFPKEYGYDDCVRMLTGVGLSQVPCWIRPAVTLSNGQRERAEIALRMAHGDGLIVIDEWTSVVDRTVAKVMSHTIQKWARKNESVRLILLSCHYDVLDWLQPDWVIDCNKQTFEDRRGSKKNGKKSSSSMCGNAVAARGSILRSITI